MLHDNTTGQLVSAYSMKSFMFLTNNISLKDNLHRLAGPGAVRERMF